ncbi:unnamed protein product [Durusdinium trenchii]|uniref:Uncharacterized protein n=2 Tax=Durusdinium trenchii TaxID=1381693 RepID=A0ABP0Q7Z1_9DINO
MAFSNLGSMNLPRKPEAVGTDLLEIDSDLELGIDQLDTGLLPCGFPEREPAELLESLWDDLSSGVADRHAVHTTPVWAESSSPPSIKMDQHEMWTLLKDIKNNPERFTDEIMQNRIVGL